MQRKYKDEVKVRLACYSAHWTTLDTRNSWGLGRERENNSLDPQLGRLLFPCSGNSQVGLNIGCFPGGAESVAHQGRKLGGWLGPAGSGGGSCLFRRREDKFPSPNTGSLGSRSLSCSPTNNDADCSASVIITLCLKIQNKSQERKWLGL